ncbi:MAG: HEAT repeat domain-containing protein, partial [Nitrospirota bacterium]|nr:HEAT repeat domain-containing protein [Nitrospirota bacterium]
MGFDEFMGDLKSGGILKRANAAAALGKLGDRRAAKDLIKALEDHSASVRNNAAFALAELDAKEAIPHL